MCVADMRTAPRCPGPFQAGDRGKVVDAAGVGARKSYKVETADKATWWYKAGSIQLSAAVHSDRRDLPWFPTRIPLHAHRDAALILPLAFSRLTLSYLTLRPPPA